jgi:AAA domain
MLARDRTIAEAFERLGGLEQHPPVEEAPPHTEIPDWADAEVDISPDANRVDPAVPLPKKFVPIAIDDVTVADEPAWLIAGLLPAHGLACIVGPPKSGKSFLASGRPASEDFTDGPVLHRQRAAVTTAHYAEPAPDRRGLAFRYCLPRPYRIERPSIGLVRDLLFGGSLRVDHFPFSLSPCAGRKSAPCRATIRARNLPIS